MSGKKLLEPKYGWKTPDRVYSISFGCQYLQDSSPAVAQNDETITANKITPFTRKLLAHPLIKKEQDAIVEDFSDLKKVW